MENLAYLQELATGAEWVQALATKRWLEALIGSMDAPPTVVAVGGMQQVGSGLLVPWRVQIEN